MSFYQNPFEFEFRQSWPLGDRQHSPSFVCPGNKNRSDYSISWNIGPYDFSSVNTLTIYFAFDRDFKNWSALAINVAGAHKGWRMLAVPQRPTLTKLEFKWILIKRHSTSI
jgi:hypothetical protein